MASSPVRVAESLANLIAYLGDEEAGARGVTYAANGRVIKVTWTGPDTFEASVQGGRSRPYKVTVHFQDRDYQDSECNCPMISDCKHVAAAAIRIAGEAFVQGYTWPHAVEALLPNGWRRSGLAKLPPLEGNALGPLSVLPRSQGNDSTPAEIEPSPTPEESAAPTEVEEEAPVPTGPWWRRYLDAADRTRANLIMTEAYKKHAFGGHTSWYTDTLPPVLAREDNRLDALARYEQEVNHAVRYYGRSKRYDDPELRAFLESDEARAMREEQARRVHEQHFFAWLDAAPAHPSNAARAVAEWRAFPQGDGMPLLCFQLLASTRKLQRSPRQASAIKTLSDDVRAGRRSMPEMEGRLTHWLAARVNIHPDNFHPDAKGFFLPYVVTDALEWLTRWSPPGLLEWDTGERVTFEPVAARLVLRPSDEGKLEWRIAIPGQEGTREILARGAQLLREYTPPSFSYYQTNRQERPPTVLLREGAALRYVDTAGMPVEVLDAVYHLGTISAERLRDSGAGARLSRKLGMQKEDAHAGICHLLPVRARVELRLDEDKQLTLAVTARAADNTVFNRLPEGDWIVAPRAAEADAALDAINPREGDVETPTPEAEPAAPTAIATAPREQDVAPLDAWLAQLIPTRAEPVIFADRTVGLSWKVTANAFRDMATLWAVRPRAVEYLGNKAVVDLLTTRRVPKFKLKVEATGMDWLTVSIQLEEEMQFLTYDEVMGALARTQERLVQLSGGRYFEREDLEEYRDKLNLLAQLGLEADGKEHRVHAMQLAGEAGQKIIAQGADAPDLAQMAQRFKALAEQFKGIPTVKFDARLRPILRPYQQSGAEFLVWACKSLGGALLADDMGLGKTLQTLTALTLLRAKTPKDRRPTLVVCPASVAHNWQREATRFAPWLKTVVIERGSARKALLANAGSYDLVIKNYALARRDIEELNAHEWMAVVVDEAQAIKNPQSEIARTVKSLRASYRIALTGTPIENRLSDLWSIMDFCVPGYFGTLTHFESSAKARGGLLTGQLLRNRLRPLLLRRMKVDVAPELPPRVEERLDCELPPAQRKTYLAELKRTRMLLEQLPGDKADKGQGRIRILAALTRLRQICCDPALVGFPEDGSGKVDVLLELLPPLFESGHKVLIFSQFVKMLDRLKPQLKATGIPLFMLTGATTGRQELVEAFEAAPAPAVFLISLKAGGTGLNLTSASHVVLFDPWWNPAVEAQAIDRTHRIGQDKTVVAFRLVASGTIEERILDLQARKQDLVRDVLESDAFNRTLTRDDLEFLLQAEG